MDPAALRAWLSENGYTREAFALEIGVHPTTVYRWLRGSIPIPRSVELALTGLPRGGKKTT
jgi:hypothetical protein